MDLKLHKDTANNEKFNFCGIDFTIPQNYVIKNGIVYEIKEKKDEIQIVPVILKPALITSVYKNIDTGNEKAELTVMKDLQKIIVDKSILYARSKVIQLADKGLKITSSIASDWIDFLYSLEVLNEEVIPVRFTTNHLGWIDDKSFMPFIKNDYELDVKEDVQTWIDSLKIKGNINDWIKVTSKFRNNEIFRFILAASFAAPLLKHTNTRSFVIYNWALSKGGKTAAAYVALSVWGLAENLKVNFNATLNGIEGLSKIFVDLPILVDEKMVDKDQQKVEKMVYELANGKSKLRGTAKGSVQANSIWRGITLTTGEEPLSNSKSQDGVRSRILEIYGKPFDDEKEASRMYKFTQENYGVAGRLFIMYLIKVYSDNKYVDLRKELDKVKSRIKAMCPNINLAQLSYIALVTLADSLIGRMFYKTDEDSSYGMAKRIVENIDKSSEKDLIDNMYNYIGDWILANDSRFDRVVLQKKDGISDDVSEVHLCYERGNKESYGVYCNEMFYIWPTKFESVLEKNGFNYEKAKQGFKERGYIECEGNTYTVSLFYNGSNREFIAIKLKSETTHKMKELKEKGLLDRIQMPEQYTGPTVKELGFKDEFTAPWIS